MRGLRVTGVHGAGPRADRQGWSRRAGFSLLEMLVVLAVLAGLMAVAWPSLRRPLQSSGAERAAASLRERFAEARHEARLSGELRLVRLEPGRAEIVVGPWQALVADTLGVDGLGVDEPGLSGTTGIVEETAMGAGLERWQLPEGVVVEAVRFGGLVPTENGEVTTLDGSTMTASTNATEGDGSSVPEMEVFESDAGSAATQDLDGLSDSGGTRWYLPFLPTGQTRDAEVWLRDPLSGGRVRVILDAVTGMMRTERLRTVAPSTANSNQSVASDSAR